MPSARYVHSLRNQQHRHPRRRPRPRRMREASEDAMRATRRQRAALAAGRGAEVELVELGAELLDVVCHPPEVLLVVQQVVSELGVRDHHVVALESVGDLEGTIGRNLLVSQPLVEADGAGDRNALGPSLEQQHVLGVVDELLRDRVLVEAPHDVGHACVTDLLLRLRVQRGQHDVGGEVRIRRHAHDALHLLGQFDGHVHGDPPAHTSADQDDGTLDDVFQHVDRVFGPLGDRSVHVLPLAAAQAVVVGRHEALAVALGPDLQRKRLGPMPGLVQRWEIHDSRVGTREEIVGDLVAIGHLFDQPSSSRVLGHGDIASSLSEGAGAR
mmetsp:Transcript_43645/g.102619  ORF Transcript_43645/g.102619 Transcript_43645/m.102619 type:complete len:327 (-) Transcript_43645:243-1223(-)